MRTWGAFLFALSMIVACGNPHQTASNQKGEIAIGVQWPEPAFHTQVIPPQTTEIRLTITGNLIPVGNPIVRTLSRNSQATEKIKVTVPIGEKQISASAFDLAGQLLARAEARVEVNQDQIQRVELDLALVEAARPTPSPAETSTPAPVETPALQPSESPKAEPSATPGELRPEPSPAPGASEPPRPTPVPSPSETPSPDRPPAFTLRLVRPASAISVSIGSQVELEAELIGAGTGARVEFTVDDQRVATAPAAPFKATWDTRGQGTGKKTLKAIALDAANRKLAESATLEIELFSIASAPINQPPPDVPPALTTFAPTSHIVGTEVTLTGTNFIGRNFEGGTTRDTVVRFNGVQAEITSISETAIKALVPAGATTGPITVTHHEGTGTSAGLAKPAFVVLQGPPTITRFNPNVGYTQTVISLQGTNFSPYKEDNTLTIAGQPATIQFASSTSLLAMVTGSAPVSTGALTATTNAGSGSSNKTFHFYGNGIGHPAIEGTATANIITEVVGGSATANSAGGLDISGAVDVLGVDNADALAFALEYDYGAAPKRFALHRLVLATNPVTRTQLLQTTTSKLIDIAVDPDDRTLLLAEITATPSGQTKVLANLEGIAGAVTVSAPQALANPSIRKAIASIDASKFFVSLGTSNKIEVISGISPFAVLQTLTLGGPAGQMVHVGDKLYVSRLGSSTVEIRNLTANTSSTVSLPKDAVGSAFSPATMEVAIVAASATDTDILIVNALTDTIVKTISLAGAAFSQGRSIAFSPDGQRAYVTHAGGKVSILDIPSKTLLGNFDIAGATLGEIKVTPDGKRLVIADHAINKVYIVD